MTSSFFSLGNAIRAFLLVGLFGVLFVLVQSCQRPATGLDAFSVGSLKKLRVRETPVPQHTLRFTAENGAEMALADLHGKTVLLNIWATWCAPCIKEMPSLDRLQGLRGGDDFEVVTISVDRTQLEPAKFFTENGIKNLAPFHDGSFEIPGKLQLYGFPTTLIYNSAGREVAFLEGDAEWDSEEALTLIDYLVAQ